MTTEDFKQLESLLGKLETHLGARYSIFPWPNGKGGHICMFDEDGRMVRDKHGPDIEVVAGLIRIQIDKPIKK